VGLRHREPQPLRHDRPHSRGRSRNPGYLALAGLALARRRALLAIATLPALAFALYLSHIEKSVLEVWCLYCVLSQGVIALIALLALGWLVAAKLSRRTRQTA